VDEPESLSGSGGIRSRRIKMRSGCFFGSILGSLNHIYVADIIWLNRFSHHPQGYLALSQLPKLSSYTVLDQTIANDLETMTRIRQELDEIIINWCQEIIPEELATNGSKSKV